jgi:hypothetical protein
LIKCVLLRLALPLVNSNGACLHVLSAFMIGLVQVNLGIIYNTSFEMTLSMLLLPSQTIFRRDAMFKLLLVTSVLLSSVFANAGSPGFIAYSCESGSGKTKLTIIERFYEEEGITILLSINGFSALYEKANLICTEDECQKITSSYLEDGISYMVNTAEAKDIEISIKDNGAAVLRKGFVHPETLQPFNSDIQLNCRLTSQQI